MLTSSLGFHTITLHLSLRASEPLSLLMDFFEYSHIEKKIIMRKTCLSDGKKKTEPISLYYDGTLLLPLETIIGYRQDIGIKWRVICNRNDPAFNSYTVEAIINPKLLSGINDYLTAATLDNMETVINNFNIEAKKISPLLKDFDYYKISRVDYCLNLSLRELSPKCSAEQIITLIRRGDVPTNYKEWTEYDPIAHRRKSKPSSFYLVNDSVHINCYSKYMQLLDKLEENKEKGYPPIPSETLDSARDIIRFEVQCKYNKTYSLNKKICESADKCTNNYKHLLSPCMCTDIINDYFSKVVGKGHWYTLQKAMQIIEQHHFNIQKKKRLICTLKTVNQCRSIAKVKKTYQGHDLESFKRTLADLSYLGINPVTIPKEWGIESIQNLRDAYYDKLALEKNKNSLDKFQCQCLIDYVNEFGCIPV